jgi:spermidine/putrescine-binding protein
MTNIKDGKPAGSASASGLQRLRTIAPMSRRRFGLSMAAAGVGLTVGYGSRSAQAVTTVNYMGWQGYDEAANAGGFLDKNEIVLQPTYMESQEQWITAMRSGGRGNMDLGTPVDMYMPFTMKAGLFSPLDLSKSPNMEKVFPEFRDLDNLKLDGKTYAVPFTFGSLPIMYNANEITEPPGSWWELFNPKYKGKAAIVQDSLGVFMIFSLMANGTTTPWNNTKEMVAKTVDLLIKFKKEQALTICAAYGDLAALLGNGEVVIAQGWEPVSTMTGENSPPIKWSYPKEGTCNFVDTFVIFADAPNLEIDHKILNHVMSVEAQVASAEKNASAVTNKDAVALLSAKTKALYPYDDIAGFFKKVGGHYQAPPLEAGSEFESLDQILKGWEEFLKA